MGQNYASPVLCPSVSITYEENHSPQFMCMIEVVHEGIKRKRQMDSTINQQLSAYPSVFLNYLCKMGSTNWLLARQNGHKYTQLA